MKQFSDKLAVVTGAGTGMGRELAYQLATEGCHVAFCDVSEENMRSTKAYCEELAPADTKISSHLCDVSDETQVLAFRDAVVETHGRNHINLLFNNAGIGGGGSFLKDPREDWEKTFGVCWFGVYYCSRAFVPLLVASDDGYLVNTSSVNGFWASLGPGRPHTAYSAAKFAVKGFSEALLADFGVNAPHVKVAVVMPGHIGTDIGLNTRKVLGKHSPKDMTTEELVPMREQMKRMGMESNGMSDEQLRTMIAKRMNDFRDKAPMTAATAATVILDGVREDRWRILVGEDAKRLDSMVREAPEQAYERGFSGMPGFGASRK